MGAVVFEPSKPPGFPNLVTRIISKILISWLKAKHRALFVQDSAVALINTSLYSDSQKLINDSDFFNISSEAPNK